MKYRSVVVFIAAVGAASPAIAAPKLILDDPLTAPFGSSQTVTGGSFSGGGWTRDGFDSQLLYDLGGPITAGRIVFEMDGVNGVDHGVGGFPDCRAIFAAVDDNGSGNIQEPGNDNVQLLWAWAMEETDYCNLGPGGFERTHKMKLLVNTMGAEEPGEPMSDPLVWDQTKFYTYEIGWDENHAWLLRDGAEVLDMPYPSAPIIMQLRYVFLGTVHRYDAGVKGATFRNLKVYDDEGPPIPSGTGGGAGAAGAAGTAGGGGAGGGWTLDGGAGSSASGGSPGAQPRGSTVPDDSGCGCRTRGSASGAHGLLGLLVLAAARRRRRV